MLSCIFSWFKIYYFLLSLLCSKNKNYNNVLILKIEGLNEIEGAEESILKNQEKLNINTTYDSDLKKFIPNDTPKDGIVELHFKG